MEFEISQLFSALLALYFEMLENYETGTVQTKACHFELKIGCKQRSEIGLFRNL